MMGRNDEQAIGQSTREKCYKSATNALTEATNFGLFFVISFLFFLFFSHELRKRE